MKNAVIIAISICTLTYLAYINNYLSPHFAEMADYSSVEEFSHRYDSNRRGNTIPQYRHVILIVIDGAKKEYLYNEKVAPCITGRWKRGGLRFDNARAMLPTVSTPNYFSLLTGAPPYIHGVTNNARRFPENQKVRTILHYLGDKGLGSRIIGFNWYKDMFRGTAGISPVECCEKDDSGEVADAAIELIDSGRLPYFTLLHFLAPDNAAHQGDSGISGEYRESIRSVDMEIGRILQQTEKKYPDALVMVTADHGMDRDGCHGGSDASSIEVPLYAFLPQTESRTIGRSVLSASIAPTIAAAAGVPLPPFAAAGPLYEMLDAAGAKECMSESIAKREKLWEALGGSGTRTLSFSADHAASLQRYDDDLTDRILEIPQKHNAKILTVQRIAAAAAMVLFALWAVYRTEPGIPVVLILNALIAGASGIAGGYIGSGFQYHIAAALFSIVIFSLVLLIHTYVLNASALIGLRTAKYACGALAALLAETVIISAIFVPFYSGIPDPHIYSFRFFILAFYSPFIILTLLLFFTGIGAQQYLIAQKERGGP